MPAPGRCVCDVAGQVLATSDPTVKFARLQALATAWQRGSLLLPGAAAETTDYPLQPVESPGRPERPELVHPRRLRRRSLHTPAGRVALLHAVAHIEFNAINLALDAVHRFGHCDLPAAYFADWISVATDEARHFRLLQIRLLEFGHDYGDLPAHDGLWDMAVRTAHDAMVRMALVPRVLEARGLDVTPGMIDGLEAAGDGGSADCLRVILREEIGHVAIGSRWYRHLCEQRGLEPENTFRELIDEYFNGQLRGPFNRDARLLAGFSESELGALGA